MFDPCIADARLNGVPVAGGRVDFFDFSPDGAGLVYHSDETADERNFSLFTTDLTCSATASKRARPPPGPTCPDPTAVVSRRAFAFFQS